MSTATLDVVTWGFLLWEGDRYLFGEWWIAFFPGLMIVITVLGFGLIGDATSETLNPKVGKTLPRIWEMGPSGPTGSQRRQRDSGEGLPTPWVVRPRDSSGVCVVRVDVSSSEMVPRAPKDTGRKGGDAATGAK